MDKPLFQTTINQLTQAQHLPLGAGEWMEAKVTKRLVQYLIIAKGELWIKKNKDLVINHFGAEYLNENYAVIIHEKGIQWLSQYIMEYSKLKQFLDMYQHKAAKPKIAFDLVKDKKNITSTEKAGLADSGIEIVPLMDTFYRIQAIVFEEVGISEAHLNNAFQQNIDLKIEKKEDKSDL